jgi:hypothetical protein
MEQSDTAAAQAAAAKQATEALEQRLLSGANWFYWIAALSLINSVIILANGSWSFIVGLGVTQIVDGIAQGIAAEAASGATAIKAVAFAVDCCVAGVVALFAFMAGRRQSWAFIVGMVLYALDGLLFLLFGDFLSVGFHAFALFGIFGGYRALREMNARAPVAVPLQPGQPQQPSHEPIHP